MEGGKVSRIVDGSDEHNSNWMRFVNCARDNKEQNLVAVQFRGEIYYKTCVPVEAGSELLVWFDDSVSCGSSTQKDQLGKLSIVALVGQDSVIIMCLTCTMSRSQNVSTILNALSCTLPISPKHYRV